MLPVCEDKEMAARFMTGAGFQNVERRFKFGRFIPPALIQRIQAKLYFGARSTTRVVILSTKCWKNAFCQSQRGIPEYDGGGNPVQVNIVVRLETSAEASLLRIISFGQFIHYQSTLTQLSDYCDAVEEILQAYPGLDCERSALCPTCCMDTVLCKSIQVTPYSTILNSLDFLVISLNVTNMFPYLSA